jgi:hypothetical protein
MYSVSVEWMSICLTYLLTPWSRVLPEKLTGFQPVKKFPALYGTRKFPLHQSISPGPSLALWQFRKTIRFLRRGVVSTSHNPQAEGPPLVGCPRLLIQYIRRYPQFCRSFLHPHPEDTQCRGDRDPLITVGIDHWWNISGRVIPKYSEKTLLQWHLFSLHIPRGEDWDWTRTFTVKGRRLTSRALVRPPSKKTLNWSPLCSSTLLSIIQLTYAFRHLNVRHLQCGNYVTMNDGLLSVFYTMQWLNIPTFRRNMLPPSSGWHLVQADLSSWSICRPEYGGSMFLRNVGTFNHYVLQKPTVDSDVIDSGHEIVQNATRVLRLFTYSWPWFF